MGIGLTISLGFSFIKENKIVEKSNDLKEAGSISMLNLIDNKYTEIYKQKQSDYQDYFRKYTINPVGVINEWSIQNEKDLLDKICFQNIGYKENEYSKYEQKTFGIKNYTIIGDMKIDQETNLIKNPTDLILQDQDNKKYKVYYKVMHNLDLVRQFDQEHAQKTKVSYFDYIGSYHTKVDPYRAVEVIPQLNNSVCLELEPIN